MTLPPRNLSIPEAARFIGIGRSLAYELLSAKKLQSVRIGSRRLVTVASITAYLESLEKQEA